MIEQQLFTRSSKGYFLNKPGYDTVRLSAGIDEQTARENNSLFVYNGKNIKGVNESIPVITRQKLNNGDVMLNCSQPYQYMSYDGVKETYISHSYIMKNNSQELKEQANDVRQIAGVTEFINTHKDGSNVPLEQLGILPFESDFPQVEYAKLIFKSHSKDFFSKIVWAVIVSALSNKKVYIVPKSITETEDILDFLKVLYFCVPIGLRNQIGYITSLNNQHIPDGVNIAFVSPTYISEIKSKNLFDYYIADDFCFDLENEIIVYSGGYDFATKKDYIEFIKLIYSYPESIENVLDYFEEQLENKIDFERINIIAKFVSSLYEKEDTINKVILNYEKIHDSFDTDVSIEHLKEAIAKVVKAKKNDLSYSELKNLVKLYDIVNEDYQDVLINYFADSIMLSLNDSSVFFEKLNICSENPKVESYIVSRFIVANDASIILYYDREFSKIHNLKDLFNKLVVYQNDTILKDDGLMSKDVFIEVVNKKIDSLFKSEQTLSFINDLKHFSNSIKNKKLRLSINGKIKDYVVDFSNKNDDYSLNRDETKSFILNYSEYADKDFIHLAKMISDIFEYTESSIEEYRANDFFAKNITQLNKYYQNYFSNHKLENYYFAYTVAYYDVFSKVLNLKEAYKNLKSVDDISRYTKWLIKAYNYTGNNCSFKSISGSDTPEDRYKDLANAILKSLSNVDDKISSKDASSYIEDLIHYMDPKNEYEEEMHEKFSKSLKKAMNGKNVERINYTPHIAKEKDLKKHDGHDFEKRKIFIIVGSILLVLGLIAAGIGVGIHLKDKNKDEVNNSETSITSSAEETKESTETTDKAKETETKKEQTPPEINNKLILLSVTHTLKKMNIDNLENVKEEEKESFVEEFNDEYDYEINDNSKSFDFDMISKQFDTAYKEYENNFKNIIEIETNEEIRNSIYNDALKEFNVDNVNDLSSDKDKSEFIIYLESELGNYASNIPNISNDLNIYYALQIFIGIYNNTI